MGSYYDDMKLSSLGLNKGDAKGRSVFHHLSPHRVELDFSLGLNKEDLTSSTFWKSSSLDLTKVIIVSNLLPNNNAALE